MLPGSFTFLLLEIANFADFAAEHFAEALHFGIGSARGVASSSCAGWGWGGGQGDRGGSARQR